MSIKKTVAIAAAAGALAAVAVPAMAFENEIHGTYTFKGFLSNYNDAYVGDMAPGKIGSVVSSSQKANNYFEQRARIFYTAKANDDVKLVTGFEMDTRFGGVTDNKYTNSSDAGVLDGDGINLETKWVYLDFNAAKNVNVKTGLMPYTDSIKGLFIDADLTAIMTTTKIDALTLGVGYSRYSEAEQQLKPTTHLGDNAKDLFIVDAAYAVSKDLKVGASYYLNEDYQTTGKTTLLHIFAANAEAKIGPATVSGFAALQTGETTNSKDKYSGYALNAAAKMPVASGTAKAAVLYVSGDDQKDLTKKTGWVGSTVQNYAEGGLIMMVRNNAATGTTNTSDFFKRTISNVGLVTVGYDCAASTKATVGANLGFAWAPEVATGKKSYIGTEIDLDGAYKLNDNLKALAQVGYVVVGDYYKDTADGGTKTPADAYTVRLGLAYAF